MHDFNVRFERVSPRGGIVALRARMHVLVPVLVLLVLGQLRLGSQGNWVVVVYHVTIVAIGHGLLKKFWPFWLRSREFNYLKLCRPVEQCNLVPVRPIIAVLFALKVLYICT